MCRYFANFLEKEANSLPKTKFRGGCRTVATSKMERFVIIVKPLVITTKRSILNVAAFLDPPTEFQKNC